VSEDKQDKKYKTTLHIPTDLHERVRVRAAKPNLSFSEIVSALLEKWVDGIPMHPPPSESDVDLFNGAMAWLREREEQGDEFWQPLIDQWRARGERIRMQNPKI